MASFEARKYEAVMGRLKDEVVRVLNAAGVQNVEADRYFVIECLSPYFGIRVEPTADIEAADGRFAQVRKEWDPEAILAAFRNGEPLPAGVSVGPRVRYAKIVPG